MYIFQTSNVNCIKFLLLYITSTHSLSLTNNIHVSTVKRNSIVENVPAEGGGKITNVTIIPGPNLDSTILDSTSQQDSTINTSSKKHIEPSIVSEGGGIPVMHELTNQKQIVVPTTDHNVVTALPGKSIAAHPNTLSSSNISDGNKEVTSLVMEAGDTPELIKGNLPNNLSSVVKLPNVMSKNFDPAASITHPHTIPVSEAIEISRKKIASRKGVDQEYAELKKLETSTPMPIKKPLLTKAAEEDEPAPTHLELNSNISLTSSTESKPKVPSLDRFTEFSNKTQEYVIPIIIVILSVPLVTIIISFLLKRGAEWWKYRHYRRMDFLINGIYDT